MKRVLVDGLAHAALLAAGVTALGSVAVGCSCGGDMMMVDEIDASRTPRVDADVDADLDAPEPTMDDVLTIREDTNEDTGPSTGFDAGPGMALDCTHRHLFGEDFWYLARDNDAGDPSFTSVAGRPGNLVGVYSTTDRLSGDRRLEVFRYLTGEMRGMDPVALAGGANGSLPTIVASGDGFWVSFVVGSEIRVARFNADMSAIGAPVVVGSDAVTTPPRLVTTSSGGYVIWVVGNTIRGRALDASGMPMGTASTLVTGAMPIQQASLQRVGDADQLALSWADGSSRPSVAPLMGGVLGTADFVGGDDGIFTSIDLGGQSAMPTMGSGVPFAGAAVYDLNDLGAKDVIFRILDDTTGALRPNFPAATVGLGGDYAWSASVEPFLSGYALAYRAILAGVESPVLRIGYLDREDCALGEVTDRFVIGLIDSETGAVPQLGVDGGTMLVVWSDERAGEYFDYWASIMTCSERS